MMMSHLVSALEVLDPRFDLTVYGGFFRQIPRRLGSNEALDAAVEAITATLPMVLSRQQPSAEACGKYAQALKALRMCLMDPSKMSSVNTMCAVYFVVICQVSCAAHQSQVPYPECLTLLYYLGLDRKSRG